MVRSLWVYILILFTNGCSWSFHGTLRNIVNDESRRKVSVWPAYLANFLQLSNFVNLADGGGSNQRILRTTYNWLLTQTKKDLEDTIAIIQITDISRFELYYPISNDVNEDLPGQWVKVKHNLVNKDSFNKSVWDIKEMSIRAETIIKNTNNIEDMYRNIGYLFALKGLFDAYGVKKYYFWNKSGLDGWNTFTIKHKEQIQKSFNILDYDEHWSYERISNYDPHPSVNGHKEIAKIIFNKIKLNNY